MSTLSFHADKVLENKIRAAAKRRQLPVSRYLKETMEASLSDSRKGSSIRGIVSGTSSLEPDAKVLDEWSDQELFPS